MTALFLVGWFWQGFLHFHETKPLASNENTALKLEVKNEYDAMLEQEYALVQPQTEALSRDHHFKHKGEDKSGFSVITITKACKCIPSLSPIGFIKCSVLPSRRVKLHCPGHWCTDAAEERGVLTPCQPLCCKADLWNWAEVGNTPSRPRIMWYSEVKLLLCGTTQLWRGI